MGQGKVIGNVGFLDLRNATEASVAEISRIGNVGVVLYSPETAGLLTRLNVGNIGVTLEAPSGVKSILGQLVLSHEYFEHREAPLDLLVVGPVVVESDVSVEDIDSGVGALSVVGPLLCPDHLLGVMQSKLRNMNGPVIGYAAASRVIMGRFDLDESALAALEDGTTLVVMGSLRLPEVLPMDLLVQKVRKLQVLGSIRCHEENAPAILARLADQQAKVTTIPAGFRWVDRPLVLDNAVLESLPASRLYCTDRIQIDPSVDATLLDDRVEALVSEDIIICPASLRSVLSRKCEILEARVVFYEGELWLIDGESTLRTSRFDYLEGQATLVVCGELTIDPGVEPSVLAARLGRVHNLGLIRCTPDQMGAIQARLGLSDGELEDVTQPQASEGGIGNVGQLQL